MADLADANWRIDQRGNPKVYSSRAATQSEIANTQCLLLATFLGRRTWATTHFAGEQRSYAQSSRSFDRLREAVAADENRRACPGHSGECIDRRG